MPRCVNGFIWDGVDHHRLFPHRTLGAKNASLLVRVKEDSQVAKRALDAAIAGVSTEVSFIVPMEEALAIQIYPFRASSWIAMGLGGLALALSLSGIYGVLSYLVSQRTKEIGIRMALGASTSSVVGIVLSQSMKLAVAGIVIGAGLALGVSRLFASELQNVDTFDALAYAGSSTVAVTAALAQRLRSLAERRRRSSHSAALRLIALETPKTARLVGRAIQPAAAFQAAFENRAGQLELNGRPEPTRRRHRRVPAHGK